MATEAKTPIRLRNRGGERGGGRRGLDCIRGNARSIRVPRAASLSALSSSVRNSFVPESSARMLACACASTFFLRCQLLCLVPLKPSYNATRDKYDRSHRGKGPTCDPLQARSTCLAGRNLGEALLFACERGLLFLALGDFALGAGREIGLRRSDFARPVGPARRERLRVDQARSPMGEEIRLARRLGLVPIGGGDQHTVEQEQRIPIFPQEIGKRRPAAQQRLMRHFERRRTCLKRGGIAFRSQPRWQALLPAADAG